MIFCPRMGGACRAPGLARGLDAMHPDRMHMQRHDTCHQSQQGQSDAPVAGRCAHHPIIRPGAPGAGMAELDRPQLALGWDRGPFPAQRTSISATTDLNRQIVYVSARASPTFLNSPRLEPFRRSGPGARTNAAALSLLRSYLPSKNHAFQSERRCYGESRAMVWSIRSRSSATVASLSSITGASRPARRATPFLAILAQVAQAAHEGGHQAGVHRKGHCSGRRMEALLQNMVRLMR